MTFFKLEKYLPVPIIEYLKESIPSGFSGMVPKGWRKIVFSSIISERTANAAKICDKAKDLLCGEL